MDLFYFGLASVVVVIETVLSKWSGREDFNLIGLMNAHK